MNDEDYKRYMMELNEYERTQIKVNYNGKMRTQDEIDEIELKDMLEEAGWNVRNLYKNKEKEKKLKKAIKKDRKREKELKKQLLNIQNRNKKRKGEDIEFDSKKKNKEKKKKKKDKESDWDGLKYYKEEAKEEFDSLLLSTVNRDDYESFKEYKEDMEDFSFASVFGGWIFK